MLQVGLTGGIGSGKSTVARRLVARGAVLVDADVLAREVVAAGTDGFAAVVAEFGERVVGPDGELDRPALGAIVFNDDAARAKLNGIVHPRVRERANQLVAEAPPDAIVVQDVPLLVEGGMAARFALVVVVHADVETRVARLVGQRGMAEDDARARIAAQADEAARRAVADAWLDNCGGPEELEAAVDRLWDERLVPFEANLRAGRPAVARPGLHPADPAWAAAGARLVARVAHAAGELARGVEHIGPTAVPDLPAPDVVEIQLGVSSLSNAVTLRDNLAAVGFVPDPSGDDAETRCFRSADPARPAKLQVREAGSDRWRAALLARDWLRADAGARAERARHDAERAAGAGDDQYAELERRWWEDVAVIAAGWAASSGWAPSLH
ncbi:dephospho-CoA kinase [Pseudonocardia thermophila]|uniref:Dephospho-CoA kinase n=1 Tax=Pseudonocardia thermophila TaxID=1848 RepID=A0A1M6ZJT7_PSETH|nr:dephospho-CoA kinase [Pseudonocardia thermophila]SHL30609.1 dephospho-CoA kinase [Pseudonocardia thermophila]